jgi:hypothetical protein
LLFIFLCYASIVGIEIIRMLSVSGTIGFDIKVIQSDYSCRITPIYRHEIINIVIRVAVATNTEVAESGATVVGPFITRSTPKRLCKGSKH